MVKVSLRRAQRRKKLKSLSRGFVLSRSKTLRSIKQQLLHSGNSARIGLKLKKRTGRRDQTKLLNSMLRARGYSYSRFKAQQKRKGCALTTVSVLDFLLRNQSLVDKHNF